MAKLKIDASLLKGLDEELKVPQAWIDGANSLLPAAIDIIWARPVAENFHPRFDATARGDAIADDGGRYLIETEGLILTRRGIFFCVAFFSSCFESNSLN